MSFMPDPLHPALVHFPIVLVLFGTLAAVVAMFWRQGFVPAMAAALLALAALGAWAAVATGESDGGLVENTSAGAAALLEAHENWAKRTLTAAAIAAVLAIGSVALFKFRSSPAEWRWRRRSRRGVGFPVRRGRKHPACHLRWRKPKRGACTESAERGG